MPSPNNQVIWTVSALNHEVKTLLERGIGRLWLEGEISNLSKPASGHWYFSLKDQQAQIRVAMFKNKNNRVSFNAANGQQVLIQASVSLYEARGEFQVIAEHMEEAGSGKLMREFEALKNKLKTEGLFDPTFKQNIPRYPNTIGIITSPTGAAIRDALSVLKRRCPATKVIIYPCVVQGAHAANDIKKALGQALQRNECDVLLMIRGGGSIEDMWCFNDESLAQLIYQSSIPIITGIGHEVDFTIADFVADYRAPTPSVAAESASLNHNEISQQIDYKAAQITQQARLIINKKASLLQTYQHQLNQLHPNTAIETMKHRLALTSAKLSQAISQHQQRYQNQITELQLNLKHLSPKANITGLRHHLDQLTIQLAHLVQKKINSAQQKHHLQVNKLDALSPLKTISRGYSVVLKNQQPIHSIQQIHVGDNLNIQVKDGYILSQVKDINPIK